MFCSSGSLFISDGVMRAANYAGRKLQVAGKKGTDHLVSMVYHKLITRLFV